MIDNSKSESEESEESEFRDEREEILDVMRENDKETWQRFQIFNLFMMHPIHATLTRVLDQQLERAGKFKFDGDWEEAKVAQIEAYLTIYRITGADPETARRKAEELAEEGGLRGLRAMF